MPRRRRAFIDRSRAKTFQLVHGGDDGPSEQVFVPHGHSSATSAEPGAPSHEGAIPVAEFGESYNNKSYELGEYGFPEDDYDYSQHFRTIGGGGGVYMDSVTGGPKPEAVASSSAARNYEDSRPPKEQVVLRESFAADDNERIVHRESWRSPEDVLQSLKAIEKIRKDRRTNQDLDEVIAALDTDGELDLMASDLDDNRTTDDLDDIIRDTLAEDSDLLEDDFIAIAKGDDEKAKAGDLLDGVIEEYREPRLLDAQFDRFMQGFELDDTDEEEEEEIRAELLEQRERMEEFAPHFQGGTFQDVWHDEDLLEELAGLQIEETDEVNDEDSETKDPDNGGGDYADDLARTREFKELKAAEFERGMTGLLDSYNRVSANDAFAAVDGLDAARNAIARAEEEEEARIAFQNEAGIYESDEHDSELDSHFDEMFKDKGEQWDCETVLSTYSNLENHPSIIDAPASQKLRSVKAQPIIRLDPRTQAPAGIDSANVTRSSRETVDYGSKRDQSVSNVRRKGETKEEKKARKAAVKEVARERRALKSEMRKAFGAENVKQGKHATALGTSKVTLKL